LSRVELSWALTTPLDGVAHTGAYKLQHLQFSATNCRLPATPQFLLITYWVYGYALLISSMNVNIKYDVCNVPRWEVRGFKTPTESSEFFELCVCAEILLCSCIYEIQKFCTGKRQKLYSNFTFCFALDPTGTSVCQIPSLRPILHNS